MKKRRFIWAILLSLIVVALLVACRKSSYNGGGGGNNSTTVYMKNMVFSNTNLQVIAGTKVTWVNDDNTNHTVTSNDGIFASGTIQPGGTFNYTFSTTGTYNYHCDFHAMMTGKVVVVAP